MRFTDKKITITGSIIETCEYLTKPLAYGFDVSRSNRARQNFSVVDEDNNFRKLESRKKSAIRAKSKIKKLLNANAWQWKNQSGVSHEPILATLTFKDDIRDVKRANTYFSNFMHRLNYMVSNRSKKSILKYLAVIEFQDKRAGVVHYHVVFFNLPANYKKSISEVWSHGFVDTENINEIDNVGTYLSKNLFYCVEDNRLDKRKHYFSSRDLLQPIEIRNQNKAKTIIDLIPKEHIKKEDYIDGYQGKVKRTFYQLSEGESLFEVVPELNNLL